MTTDLTTVAGYYDRSAAEAEKRYTQHLFRAGNVLQGAELNELQAYSRSSLKLLGDAVRCWCAHRNPKPLSIVDRGPVQAASRSR